MVVLGSLGGEWGRLDLAGAEPSAWIAFGYLVLVGSVVGYSAYVWLLARAPLSLATTYAYVNPAVAVALGALFLAEPLTPSVLVGGAVIIAAVAFVITPSRVAAGRRSAARYDVRCDTGRARVTSYPTRQDRAVSTFRRRAAARRPGPTHRAGRAGLRRSAADRSGRHPAAAADGRAARGRSRSTR